MELRVPFAGAKVNALKGALPAFGKLDWVIVGGESGHNARPMHPDWARSLRDQCVDAGVPFFFKQWGGWLPIGDDRHPIEFSNGKGEVTSCEAKSNGQQFVKVGKKAAGRLLDGRVWDEMPERG